MRYTTSDLHFYHNNILRLSPKHRPWSNMDEMTDGLISAINSLENCEMLYHVGDFCFANVNKKLRPILDRINVPITFIKGNHDNSKMVQIVQEEYGHRVENYLETKHNGKKVVMFHYPIYKDWNMAQHGSVHLFGHIHGRGIGHNGKSLDVGWDAHGRILTLDEAVRMADKYEIDTFH